MPSGAGTYNIESRHITRVKASLYPYLCRSVDLLQGTEHTRSPRLRLSKPPGDTPATPSELWSLTSRRDVTVDCVARSVCQAVSVYGSGRSVANVYDNESTPTAQSLVIAGALCSRGIVRPARVHRSVSPFNQLPGKPHSKVARRVKFLT